MLLEGLGHYWTVDTTHHAHEQYQSLTGVEGSTLVFPHLQTYAVRVDDAQGHCVEHEGAGHDDPTVEVGHARRHVAGHQTEATRVYVKERERDKAPPAPYVVSCGLESGSGRPPGFTFLPRPQCCCCGGVRRGSAAALPTNHIRKIQLNPGLPAFLDWIGTAAQSRPPTLCGFSNQATLPHVSPLKPSRRETVLIVVPGSPGLVDISP